jgi:hypothetical protein
MGIALLTVQRSRGKRKRNTYIVFGLRRAQCFLVNHLLHFHALGAAFIEIIALGLHFPRFLKISPQPHFLFYLLGKLRPFFV